MRKSVQASAERWGKQALILWRLEASQSTTPRKENSQPTDIDYIINCILSVFLLLAHLHSQLESNYT